MIVLLGNIKSETTETAEGFRIQLQSMLERINREGKDIVAPYSVAKNGEFQAVYSGIDHVFDHIWLVLYQMHPVEVHFSVGLSGIAAEANHSPQNDDPAFRYAREGLEHLAEEFGLFRIQTDEEVFLPLMNHSLMLVSRVMRKWKKKRFAVLYGLSRSRTVGEIAGLLDISERSVYKNIRAGSLDTILSTVDEISALLKRYFQQGTSTTT